MRPFRTLLRIALIAACGWSATARAQEQDLQQWTLLAATGKVSGDVVIWAEVQPRITDDVGRLGQLLIRPAIGYQIDRDVQFLAGYAYVRTDPLGRRATNEHRAWQQLIWPIAKGSAGLNVFARTRLEQRTVEGFAAHWEEINAFTNLTAPQSGSEQSGNILKAMQKVTGTGPASARG